VNHLLDRSFAKPTSSNTASTLNTNAGNLSNSNSNSLKLPGSFPSVDDVNSGSTDKPSANPDSKIDVEEKNAKNSSKDPSKGKETNSSTPQQQSQQSSIPKSGTKYTLDKSIFYLREAEIKRKISRKKATEVMSQLPKVPKQR